MIRIAMTRPQFEAAKVEVAKAVGVETMTDSGIGKHGGVKVSYLYDGAHLDITILDKPFFVPESVVEDKIMAYFASAK